jgi:hypothetical protein
VPELYDQFSKFNKSKIQHFRKLEQHSKVANPEKAARVRYGDNQCNYPKTVHIIGSEGGGPSEN